MQSIELNVDGRSVRVRRGATLLDAARAAGADVPHLCHVPGLPSRAVCRMCLVEVEGSARPVAACHVAAQGGMAVRTDGDGLAAIRRAVVEMALAEHGGPCGRDGCEVDALARDYGVMDAPWTPPPARPGFDRSSDYIAVLPAPCVHCDRCIRACGDRDVIRRTGWGTGVSMGFRGEGALDDAGCTGCGDCVAVCPAGVLRSLSDVVRDERRLAAASVAAPAPALSASSAAAPPLPVAADDDEGPGAPAAPAGAGDAGSGRKRFANVFIAAVVAMQVLLPLRYYVSDDEFDERFSWRMFSPIRMIDCSVSWATGPERTPVDARDHVHDVWISLMKRARVDVVEGFARFLCQRQGGNAQVYVDLTCPHPDGQARRPIPADLNLCEVRP